MLKVRLAKAWKSDKVIDKLDPDESSSRFCGHPRLQDGTREPGPRLGVPSGHGESSGQMLAAELGELAEESVGCSLPLVAHLGM